jgi:glycosyltransferase involved in cell wall biosynthesis
LNIHRLPSLPHALESVHQLSNFPFPVNPVWIQTIGSVIRRNSVDLILVRDILLVFPSAILGKVFGIPVVLDMAENYPAMLQDRLRYTPTSLLGRLARNPVQARFVEWLCLRMVDHTIVVVEESQERLVRAGLSPDRLSIVNNTPRPNQWSSRETRERDSGKGGLALVYFGNLDGSRGIDVTIQALRHLKDQDFLATLSVIGEGPNLNEFRDTARQLGVADRVTFTGRLPFSNLQDFVARSDVGLIPHYATDAWNTTIPNKLFDYMACQLPVIVSDAKPMARVVREERCGMVFNDRDPYDLARCVKGLVDPAVRQQMGLCGQAAIRRRYNWDHDSHVLVKTLETVRMRHVS